MSIEYALDPNEIHYTDASTPKTSALPDFHRNNRNELLNEAKVATDVEKRMSIGQAIKTYPKAVIFSMILSTAIIMEGYDVVLLANLYAFPSFNKRYGSPTGDPKNPYRRNIQFPYSTVLYPEARVCTCFCTCFRFQSRCHLA